MASSSHSKKKTNFYGSKLCTVTGVVSSAVAPNVDILFLFKLPWQNKRVFFNVITLIIQ